MRRTFVRLSVICLFSHLETQVMVQCNKERSSILGFLSRFGPLVNLSSKEVIEYKVPLYRSDLCRDKFPL